MTLTIDQVYRDYNTQGVPASGDYKPKKSEIRALVKQIQNSGGLAVTRNTYTALSGVTPPSSDYMGIVLDDPDPNLNGYYSRIASAWVWERGFPDTFAEATLSGTGTAQVATFTAKVNPAEVQVFFASVAIENTGPLTLSVGGTVRPVVNAAGNPLSAGEWTGVVLFFLNDAGKYQLINDAGAAVAAAQSATDADADADRAEAARDAALAAGANEFAATRADMKALDTSSFGHAYLTEQGREGQFVFRFGDYSAEVASDPLEAVYIKANDTASSSGAWMRTFAGPVYANWFGVIEGDDAGNAAANDAPLLAMRNFIASSGNPYKECWFASGYYWFDNFPNCAIRHAKFWPDGEVHLRYNGTGNAIVLDGLATYDAGSGLITYEGVRHLTWGPFIIEAKATALNGFLIRSCHFSKVHPHVKGAGSASAGIIVEWCVCTDFYPYCSGNGDGWYLGAKPTYGMVLTRTTSLGANYVPPSYCSFWNPVLEVCDVGLYAIWSNGNMFYGGTMEGNTSVGASLDANSQYTRFYGTDFEANGTYDLDITGHYNEFHGIESLIHTVIESAAKENKFFGGSFEKISVAATAFNLFSGVSFNRAGTGFLADAGGKAGIVSCYDTTLGLRVDANISNVAVTVGASPFTITNDTNNDQVVTISAGTIAGVSYTPRGGSAVDTAETRIITLRPGDATTVTYTGSPTIRRISA